MPIRKLILILFLLCEPHTFCDSLSIFFLGDTYFGESYQINPQYNDGVNVIEDYGYDYFFENVNALLGRSDYIIANLETSLNPEGVKINSLKPYLHWSYGTQTCRYLFKYGVDAVSLGNNHVMDYGQEGYSKTTTLLDKFNISYFGAGVNSSAALSPLIKDFGGKFKIAVIAGFEYRPSYDTLYNFYAGKETPGVYKLDENEVIRQIQYLKQKDSGIFIVIFPHWGKNYKQAMEYQKEMARALADAGADLVVGHGAHTVQEAEYYNGKLILYNIGNFIFNAPGRYKSTGAKPYGLITELVVTGDSKFLRLHPVFTDNLKSDYQLRFLDKDEFNDCGNILRSKENINKLTDDRNYFEKKLY